MKSITHISADQSQPLLEELRQYKQLIYYFTWREFKVRYKQTALGVLWVGLQPLVFMAIVQIILLKRFGGEFGVPDIPAYLMVFLGFVVWGFTESSFSGSMNSFIANQNLFKKIYFPKIIPVISAVIARTIDLVFGILILIAMSLMFGYNLHWQGFVLLIPVVIMLAFGAGGIGLFLGSLNVKYRDIKMLQPFFTRIVFLATPVFWPLDALSVSLQEWMYFNPATAGIQTMREAFYGPEFIKWAWLWRPLVTVVIVFLIGIVYFRRKEKGFVDIA